MDKGINLRKRILAVVGVIFIATIMALNINMSAKSSGNMDFSLSNGESLANGEVTFCIGPNSGGWGQCVYYSYLTYRCVTSVVHDCEGVYTTNL